MFDLLTAAALQIWDRRKAAMIIVALPLVLNGLAEILFLFFTGDDVLWPDLILFVTSMGTVPLIAVAWHRLVLQSAPVRAVPAGPFAVHLRFLWEWFWLGFGLGVVLALGLVATVFLASLFLSTVHLNGAMDALLIGDSFLAFWGFIFAFLALLYRLCILLPHRVIRGTGLSLRSAWSATRSQGQAILWAAFWASLVQAAVFRALAVSLSYTAGILIGAAVLNVIYQRARLPS